MKMKSEFLTLCFRFLPFVKMLNDLFYPSTVSYFFISFRFFRLGTLRRRRSASCPNLADAPPVTKDGSYKRAESLFESDDSEAGGL